MEQHKFKSAFDALCDTPQESANMRLRADMMLHIQNTITDSGLTQKEIAQHCGITQPRLNDLLNGKISKFSLDALVNINASLGHTATFEFAMA